MESHVSFTILTSLYFMGKYADEFSINQSLNHVPCFFSSDDHGLPPNQRDVITSINVERDNLAVTVAFLPCVSQ